MQINAFVTTKYGAEINTDDIIRADILQEEWDKQNFAKYAFDKFDPEFRARCQNQANNVIIAGSNFGSGSSREQAVYAIQYNNVSFVVAEKDPKTGVAFPDIFYRNSINNNLPLIAVESVEDFSVGDELALNLEKRTLQNLTNGKTVNFEMSEEDLATLRDGGLIGLAKKDLQTRLKKMS